VLAEERVNLAHVSEDLEAIRQAGGQTTYEPALARAIELMDADPEGAIRALKGVPESVGTNEVFLLAKSMCLARLSLGGSGNPQDGARDILALVNAAIGQRVNYALAYYSRGRVAEMGGASPEQAEGQVRDYQRVVEIAPQWWLGWESLAGVLMNLGRHQEAMKAAIRAIDLEPRAELPFDYVERALEWVTPPQDLEAILSRAIQRQPKNAAAVRTRGVLYEKMGRLEGAHRDTEPRPQLNRLREGDAKILRDAFNRDVEKVRLLLLVSPT
jgi:tetratricopeptide (TPR) repeat protein